MRWIIQFFRAVAVVFRLGGPERVFELEKKALFDPLTGLYNPSALEEVGSREIERAKRYKHSLSVIFLDLDNLKPINDQFGHPMGNKALKKVADFLRKICRTTDIVFRYGGDEFIIIAPETGRTGAEKVVQRIKTETLFIETSSGGKTPIEMSCGIAVWYEGLLLSDLISEADKRMYEDKNNSRKRRAKK